MGRDRGWGVTGSSLSVYLMSGEEDGALKRRAQHLVGVPGDGVSSGGTHRRRWGEGGGKKEEGRGIV